MGQKLLEEGYVPLTHADIRILYDMIGSVNIADTMLALGILENRNYDKEPLRIVVLLTLKNTKLGRYTLDDMKEIFVIKRKITLKARGHESYVKWPRIGFISGLTNIREYLNEL